MGPVPGALWTGPTAAVRGYNPCQCSDFFNSPFSCVSVPSPQRARSGNLLIPMAAPLATEPCLESLLKHADFWGPGICIKEMPPTAIYCRQPSVHPGDRLH